MRKGLLAVLALIGAAALLLGAAVAWSPYRAHVDGDRPMLATTTDVDAPCTTVFDYLGNSANASLWSVYVDHITPLNAPEVGDGSRGSIRRSFRNADETGMRWDEDFVEVVPGQRRKLRIFNVVGAPVTVDGTLMTEQLYEPQGEKRCRLTFTLFFAERPSAADWVKMRIAAHEIGRIFRRNIANIGRLAAGSDTAHIPDGTHVHR